MNTTKNKSRLPANKLMQDMEDVYNFVEKMSDLTWDATDFRGEDILRPIRNEARRIRKKFKEKP